MELTRGHWLLIAFTFLYTLGFGGYYLIAQNYEFLWYVAILLFFVVFIGATISRTQFPVWLLWLLSIWGLLHMAGGGIRVGDGVLYAYQIVRIFGEGESCVLKFDQAVHFYGFFVATLVMWHLLKPYVSNPHAVPVLLTVLFAGMGLGALNEVVEFIAVVLAPETGVGGYYNTALDLVFNTFGAIAAVMGVRMFGRR